jgi:6-pyruvoyltetrahydropterin/6-carboxytetrahydropterin synthase
LFEIVVEDTFSAAHQLRLYDGSLEPRHGHDWRVAVTVRASELDEIGVVVDFEWLKPALRGVLSELSHMNVNDHAAFAGGKANPSTENIARHIHDRLKPRLPREAAKITKVTVWETPDACASYLP